MAWKGVFIEESLDSRSILNLVKIVKSRKAKLEKESKRGILTFHYIELDDENKNEFIKKAVSSIKDRFYIHICKGSAMIVIFKNKIFEFSANQQDKLNEARIYG